MRRWSGYVATVRTLVYIEYQKMCTFCSFTRRFGGSARSGGIGDRIARLVFQSQGVPRWAAQQTNLMATAAIAANIPKNADFAARGEQLAKIIQKTM